MIIVSSMGRSLRKLIESLRESINLLTSILSRWKLIWLVSKWLKWDKLIQIFQSNIIGTML